MKGLFGWVIKIQYIFVRRKKCICSRILFEIHSFLLYDVFKNLITLCSCDNKKKMRVHHTRVHTKYKRKKKLYMKVKQKKIVLFHLVSYAMRTLKMLTKFSIRLNPKHIRWLLNTYLILMHGTYSRLFL